MFSGIYHIGYQTDDIDAAISFYETVFGGKLKQQILGPDGTTKMAFVKIGESEIELIEPSDKSRLGGKTGLILDHVGYAVKDIDAAIAILKSKGIAFQNPSAHVNAEGWRLLYLDMNTTNGAKVHITQPPIE